jgi:hypothetical protein
VSAGEGRAKREKESEEGTTVERAKREKRRRCVSPYAEEGHKDGHEENGVAP